MSEESRQRGIFRAVCSHRASSRECLEAHRHRFYSTSEWLDGSSLSSFANFPGLDLLASLPDIAARAQQELALQIALGSQLMAIKGWGARDVEVAYGRAQSLAPRVEDAAQRFPALWGLWLYHWGRGELGRARGGRERVLRRYSLDAMVQRYEALYRAVHSAHSRAGDVDRAARPGPTARAGANVGADGHGAAR